MLRPVDSPSAALPSQLSNPRRIGKIAELEGLRGILAWWVVISHLLLSAGINRQKWHGIFSAFYYNFVPVDVFIILSGLVVFLLLDQQQVTYRQFILRRFFRLYPVYLPCLILGGVGYWLTTTLSPEVLAGREPANFTERWQAIYSDIWIHLGSHLTMLHGMIPPRILPYSATSLLYPAWSISLEWQFYLIAPLLFRWVTGSAIRFWGMGVLLIAAEFWGLRMDTYHPPSFLPLKLSFFGIGAIT